jgi:hypothetical protein
MDAMNLTTALAQLASAAAVCAAAAQEEKGTAAPELLFEQQRSVAASSRLMEATAATLAADVADRSRPELGHDGLAQRLGARTPERLVQLVTGVSKQTAGRLVRVGVLTATAVAHDADPSVEVAEPWLAPVLRAAAAGALSGEVVEAIRLGLGAPTEGVTADALTSACANLTTLAATLPLEVLAARAREARDDLDAAGVALREEERRERRWLHLTPQADGMTRISGLLDPESAAVIKNAVDAATSPASGGPRFVDKDDRARAHAIEADPRTPGQAAADALVELVGTAVRTHDTGLLGVRRADVRVLVTDTDLHNRTGAAWIEGQSASVSTSTAERHACDSGYLPVHFSDTGQALNLGHTHRFHTTRQRAAISARDGGCISPDCDRPPSWCEVHHINEHSLGGDTSVADGVLLCRHHHLDIHNNHKRIKRIGDQYWLIHPPGTGREPTLLHTKSPVIRRLLNTG